VSRPHEHGVVLAALLHLPVVVMTVVVAVDAAARVGSATALRLRSAYLGATPLVQLAALAMLISATVHLVLAGTHLWEARVLGSLYALDGLALLAMVAWALLRPFPGWRPVAVGLLAAGVLAYAAFVVAGLETADAMGMITKTAELSAIVLLAVPSRGGARRWSRLLTNLGRTGGLAR
jgi:hypothetical protein